MTTSNAPDDKPYWRPMAEIPPPDDMSPDEPTAKLPWCYSGHSWDNGTLSYCMLRGEHGDHHRDSLGRTWR